MTNININFGGNTARPGNLGNAPSISKESMSPSSADSNTNQVSYQNASPQTTLNLLTERMLSKVTTLNAMEAKELAALVKELLSMPKEWQALLALLALGENNTDEMAKLLKDLMAKLNVKNLQELIGKNAKEVINKLIMLTQKDALFFEGSNQLRDILGFIQKISIMAQASPSDALITAMILYLPWLPLAEQQKLELTFGFKESSKEEDKEDIEVLIMYLTTAHIGTFRVTIILNKDKTLEISIENDHIASDVIESIVNNINQELDNNGLKRRIVTSTRKSPETRSPAEMKSEGNKRISLHPSGQISVITINTGYNIAKIIFAIDEKAGVLKAREEKIK